VRVATTPEAAWSRDGVCAAGAGWWLHRRPGIDKLFAIMMESQAARQPRTAGAGEGDGRVQLHRRGRRLGRAGLGGVLAQALSWHWIFFVNAPIGAAAIAAGWLLLKDERRMGP
jgi:hypothetical protein